MEIHKLSKKVGDTGNEIGQYLNIGGFACFSRKPKENRTFCLNSDCARKLRTPTSCSDLKFFKLWKKLKRKTHRSIRWLLLWVIQRSQQRAEKQALAIW